MINVSIEMEPKQRLGKIFFAVGMTSLGIEFFAVCYSVPASIGNGLRVHPIMALVSPFIGSAIVISVILLSSSNIFMKSSRVHSFLITLGVSLIVVGIGLGIYGFTHPIAVSGYGGTLFVQPFSLEAFMLAFTGASLIVFTEIFGWAKRIDDRRRYNAGTHP